MESKQNDEFHKWTSVLSWQLMAAIHMEKVDRKYDELSDRNLNQLKELFNEENGFWFFSTHKKDIYRGILHSAQPILALTEYLDSKENKSKEWIKDLLLSCYEKYIVPMTKSNPFGFMPYGQFKEQSTSDVYHPFGKHFMRFFMPDCSERKINHGLSGHWMSWAHALARMGDKLNMPNATELAWKQIYWLTGNNPFDICFISGVGYNNPMPHARFFGTINGGFMNGFIGDAADQPMVDMERRAQWNTTEYWNTPLANCMMAFSYLLKKENNQLLGIKEPGI
jgi:hypothetical protein